jgi:phosphatidylglycerophosphate synthase
VVVYFEASGDRHRSTVGGVTALERRVRELAKEGATRAIVAAAPVETRPLPIPVEFVPPETPPPPEARRERADVVAGIELVDDAACRRAEWVLIRRMNKSFQGPVDAAINWRISMRITRLLCRTSLAFTPNHITILSILVGVTASLVASAGTYAALAIGGVLMQVQSILDSCDGELARLRFQYSRIGQWLDNLSDDIVDNLFPLAIGYVLGGAWLWIAVGAVAGRLVVALYTYVTVYRRTGTGDVFAFRWWFEGESTTTDELYKPSLVTYLRSLGRRDTFVFVWMLACLAGFPQWVVGHAAGIAAVYTTLFLLQISVFRTRAARAS